MVFRAKRWQYPPMSEAGFHSHLEKVLSREWDRSNLRLKVTGTTSPLALALLVSQAESSAFHTSPHLVITADEISAQNFVQSLKFFDPKRNAYVLGGYDVSPYSSLYPKRSAIAARMNFLWHAQNAKPGDIFVAPVEFLLQKTLPYRDLATSCRSFRKGQSLPEDLNSVLQHLGYLNSPMVEDVGQYSVRGGIVDIYSPAHELPVRLELFGDEIESLRFFDPEGQRSSEDVNEFHLIPPREIQWSDDKLDSLILSFRKSVESREIDNIEFEESLRALSRMNDFNGIDFLLPFFFKELGTVLDHFSSSLKVWSLDRLEIGMKIDTLWADARNDYNAASKHLIRLAPELYWMAWDKLEWPEGTDFTEFYGIETAEFGQTDVNSSASLPYPTFSLADLTRALAVHKMGQDEWLEVLDRKLRQWRNDGHHLFIGVKSSAQSERLRIFLDKKNWQLKAVDEKASDWNSWVQEQDQNTKLIHAIPRALPEALRIPEDQLIFVRDEDLLGRKTRLRSLSAQEEFQKTAKRLTFGDLQPGDCVVHIQHGIGVYDGLKLMNIGGVENEFIQLSYKDKDKLYLPVYRVGQLQKYSGHASTTNLDRLGTGTWEKTKSKVKNALKDLASDLLKIYAQRAEMHRPAFPDPGNDLQSFENAFPYDETDDQLRSINEIIKDFESTKPMDRLICGDVGFGKTEVAMRAAFFAAHARKQVAILAPTTVLTFQHLETFRKRFDGWPLVMRCLNRFVTNAEAKKTLMELKEGRVDILIGTHRLLSKDVQFKDLGLLIIDEEQKFGVAHKEKIRKLKVGIDTIALSATPIPRTLNMSLMGIRDLSLINTAPVDRLPTRTFITKWDKETIRKALYAEVQRGGQVYFIHNRVQSIYALADEIRELVPDLRIRVGHGQMEEEDLEKTMVAFFNHEIDILICTTIVESGMDVPRANTMFIDQAHTLGLSQLYQLRGRVGRSKQRAYCYLLLPRHKQLDKLAQERLKVIQENTALGSGIKIAQYDLELRGAGNILGESQSGHIDSVGYELYMDLLNEAVADMRGEPVESMELDPEINLRIPAMIPDNYISDIRIRLSYYKALADIRSAEELESIEEELKDQFGQLPEPTVNLMGLMLIRAKCRELGIRDLSAGPKNISLLFSEKTPVKPERVIQIAMRENKKYAVTPDNRLNIRMNESTWPRVYDELQVLEKILL